MDVADINAPQESAHRVARGTLKATAPQSKSARRAVSRSRRTLVAVGAAVLVTCVVVLFALNFPSGNVAFAQVQQQLESTQSLSYVEYLNEAGAKAKLREAENLLEMMTIEVEAMKEQGKDFDSEQADQHMEKMRKYIPELKSKIENGDPVVERRVWIQGRFLHRTEHPGMGVSAVSITNAKTGESVTLDRERKSCTVLKTQTVLNMQTGEKKVTDLGPNPAANFYAAMTRIPPGAVTRVGQKIIDGKQVVGFQQTEDLHDYVVKRTYWIDKQTELPVRLEADVQRDGVVIRGSTIRDMVFDQKIDMAMFSTTPPKGYTVREGGLMGLDPGTPAD